jgi:hypothetical protein
VVLRFADFALRGERVLKAAFPSGRILMLGAGVAGEPVHDGEVDDFLDSAAEPRGGFGLAGPYRFQHVEHRADIDLADRKLMQRRAIVMFGLRPIRLLPEQGHEPRAEAFGVFALGFGVGDVPARGFAEGERARLLAAAAGAMSERVFAFKAQHLMRRVALRPCLARVASRTGPKPILRRLPARRYTTTQLAEPRGVICK